MSTDIKISELNEITNSCDLNFIIVNDRDNTGEEGITKKIQLGNLLTNNIVKSNNIQNRAVDGSKIELKSITCDNIACNTITRDEIAPLTISRPLMDTNTVDPRVLDGNCSFTMANLTVNPGIVHIQDPLNGQLNVESGRTRLNGVPYTWPSNAGAVDYFLQSNGAGQLKWAQASVGNSPGLAVSDIMPVGTIVPWAGTGSFPDDGKWIKLDGTHNDGGGLGTFDSTLYPELASVLGTTWGTNVGVHYKLPNFAGRVVVGTGTHFDGNTTCIFTKTDTGGKYSHQLTIAEMPTHTHLAGAANGNATNQSPSPFRCVKDDREDVIETDPAGGDGYHNNVQPYTSTTYIIKAKKDDLVQFTPTLGPGLSARDATGQTSSMSLTSTEIGLNINTNGLEFDSTNKLKVSGDLTVDSISFTGDPTSIARTLSTYSEPSYYNILAVNTPGHTTPTQMRASRLTSDFLAEFTKPSRGSIEQSINHFYFTIQNSVMYTMWVNNTNASDVTKRFYNFANDDRFFVYINDSLVYTGTFNPNTSGLVAPRVVDITLPTGESRIDIVKNDEGLGHNSFEFLGDFIGDGVYFIPKERRIPYPTS